MAKRKVKRKTKRKATPAQLRALKKARAAMKKKRGKKRGKKRTRRNPAYGNYQKARAVARGSRAANPVKKLAPKYAIKKDGRYFDGAGFTSKKTHAAEFGNKAHCRNVAQKLADATGAACSVVNLRA